MFQSISVEPAQPQLNSKKNPYTVKLLLGDQWRDHQNAVVAEKGSPNATKVYHTK